MGVDLSRLSQKAQMQVLKKLMAEKKTPAPSANKYGNQKAIVNGIEFDSKREARRYMELEVMARAGEIQNLQRQVKYELLPNQKIDGKVVERAVAYVADFVYEKDGEAVVEDTKGHRTRDYILKRKMMLFFHGIRIREV